MFDIDDEMPLVQYDHLVYFDGKWKRDDLFVSAQDGAESVSPELSKDGAFMLVMFGLVFLAGAGLGAVIAAVLIYGSLT